jgi:hypothetical protein
MAFAVSFNTLGSGWGFEKQRDLGIYCNKYILELYIMLLFYFSQEQGMGTRAVSATHSPKVGILFLGTYAGGRLYTENTAGTTKS